MTIRTAHRRPGFTLVEIMVAAALSLVIMTLLALAFQSAMSTMSTLKAMGDQADRLRTAEVLMRADLDGEHVSSLEGVPQRLSDLRFDKLSNAPTVKGGYVAIQTTASKDELADADGIHSTRMNAPGDNVLRMVSRRSGRTPSDFFGTATASVKITDSLTGGSFDWAEVRWQLDLNSKVNDGGVDMWNLCRSVRLLAPLPGVVGADGTQYSINPNDNTVNTLVSVAVPANRSTTNGPFVQGSANYGDDIVLTNVTSFEVKPLYSAPVGPSFAVQPVASLLHSPFSDTPFDTGTVGNTRRCTAVKVVIRVFDPKTRLSRQMSMVVKV